MPSPREIPAGEGVKQGQPSGNSPESDLPAGHEMRASHLMLRVAVGIAILAFVVGLGFALWWLVYFQEALLAAVLLVVGLAVASFVPAAVRHRAVMGWTVLFLAAFSLL